MWLADAERTRRWKLFAHWYEQQQQHHEARKAKIDFFKKTSSGWFWYNQLLSAYHVSSLKVRAHPTNFTNADYNTRAVSLRTARIKLKHCDFGCWIAEIKAFLCFSSFSFRIHHCFSDECLRPTFFFPTTHSTTSRLLFPTKTILVHINKPAIVESIVELISDKCSECVDTFNQDVHSWSIRGMLKIFR